MSALSRGLWCGVLFVHTIQAFAAVVPVPGRGDSRIRTAVYDADQVYHLQGFLGYAIDLQFAPEEAATGVGGGDIEGLVVGITANHLTVKPKAAPLQTNFVIFTTLRTYHIDYRVSREMPGVSTEVIYAVRFIYPLDLNKTGPSVAQRVDAALEKPRPYVNTDYWYCGDEEIKPIAAYDDGVQTHLRFAPGADWPAVYLHNSDGSESLLNFSVSNNEVVIHGVAMWYVVRRGTLSGCITNYNYAYARRRTDTGTLSSDVRRELKPAAPR